MKGTTRMAGLGSVLAPVFWRYIDPDGQFDECWTWRGAHNRWGYGHFAVRIPGQQRRHFAAHRVSYFLHHGEDPHGLVVRHACDNPGCANPVHLATGTNADNMRDAVERGGWRAPLTSQQVQRARELLAGGADCVRVAAAVGASLAQIALLRRGRTFRRPLPEVPQ